MPTNTPNPDEFDYFKRGEPSRFLRGKSATNEFDYFRRGEPFVALDIPATAIAYVDSVTISSVTSIVTVGGTFPSTPLLDDLSSAGALNANWTTPATGYGDPGTMTKDVGGAYAPVAASVATAYYNGLGAVGPNSEVYARLQAQPSASGNQVQIWLRGQDPGGVGPGLSSYFLRIDVVAGTWAIRKKINGATSTLIASGPTQVVGTLDWIGFSAVGNTLTAYYRPNGGSWVTQFSTTDSAITAAGVLALTISDFSGTAMRVGQFSGGAVVTVLESADYVDSATITSITTPGLLSGGPVFLNPVVDNFNRTENPLASGWVPRDTAAEFFQWRSQVSDGTVFGTTSGKAIAAWQPSTDVLTDCDASLDIATVVSGSTIDVCARMLGSVGTDITQGYCASHGLATTSFSIRRINSNTSTTTLVLFTATALSAGDALGIRCYGSTLEIWARRSGVWSFLGRTTDTDFASGYTGMRQQVFSGAGAHYDNFATGSLILESTDYVESATISGVTSVSSSELYTHATSPPEPLIQPLLVLLRPFDGMRLITPVRAGVPGVGFNYTDSATISGVTSVQSSENTDFLDTSGSINGTSSVISTETAQYVEAATVSSTTSLTSVETTDYVETATISSITTLTVQVETYPTQPASVTPLLIKIAGKGVRLHNLILNPADSVRVNYTDSATVAGVTSIQSSENTDFLDTSGTVQGTSSITSTETAQFVESATVAGVTSISTTDTAQYVDSATGATVTVVTSADVAAYVDSATVSSVTSITSVDTADYVETATIAGVTTVTTADQYIPFTTAPLTITPQPLLIALARHGLLHNNRLNPADSVRVNYVDSATITSVTATTSTETGDWVDTAGTISGTSTVTSTETAQYVDSSTAAGVTSLTTTETSSYVDQNTGATVTVVTSTETTDYVETALVTSITSLQSNEQYAPLGVITQFAPVPLLIKFGHGTKLHNNRLTFADSVRVNYVESATISTSTSPTSTETTDFVDGVPATCKTTITYTDVPSGTDALTVNGTTTPLSTETAQYVESGLLRTVTSVFSVEDYVPNITAYSDLYIIGAQSRWAITEAMPRWSISSTRQRWQLMAHSPRWAVQGVKRRWAGWSH